MMRDDGVSRLDVAYICVCVCGWVGVCVMADEADRMRKVESTRGSCTSDD